MKFIYADCQSVLCRSHFRNDVLPIPYPCNGNMERSNGKYTLWQTWLVRNQNQHVQCPIAVKIVYCRKWVSQGRPMCMRSNRGAHTHWGRKMANIQRLIDHSAQKRCIVRTEYCGQKRNQTWATESERDRVHLQTGDGREWMAAHVVQMKRRRPKQQNQTTRCSIHMKNVCAPTLATLSFNHATDTSALHRK